MSNDIKQMYVEISPELARHWLESNTRNRNVRKSFVRQLVKKIKNGEWQEETLDAIGFYEDNTLANGQHRLEAIAAAGIPVRAYVKWNIPLKAANCIDSGKNRTASDIVSIMTGHKFYNRIISNAMRYCFEGGKDFTPEDHIKIAENYAAELEFVYNVTLGMKKCTRTSEMVASLFLATVAGVDQEELRSFCNAMKSLNPHDERDSMVVAFAIKLNTEALSSANCRRKDYNYEINRIENLIYNYVKHKYVKNFVTSNSFRYPKLILPR